MTVMPGRANRPRRRRRYRSAEPGAVGAGLVVFGAMGLIVGGTLAFVPHFLPRANWPQLSPLVLVGIAVASALVIALGVIAIAQANEREPASRGASRPQRTSSSSNDWRQMEHTVCAWLQSLGELDARVGVGTGDGGVDVESSRYVVQVKHWNGNVGGPAVRQIAGVAFSRGKQGVVVAHNGYTRDAITFSEQGHVALFEYPTGELRPVNHHARTMLDRPRRLH